MQLTSSSSNDILLTQEVGCIYPGWDLPVWCEHTRCLVPLICTRTGLSLKWTWNLLRPGFPTSFDSSASNARLISFQTAPRSKNTANQTHTTNPSTSWPSRNFEPHPHIAFTTPPPTKLNITLLTVTMTGPLVASRKESSRNAGEIRGNSRIASAIRGPIGFICGLTELSSRRRDRRRNYIHLKEDKIVPAYEAALPQFNLKPWG